MLLCLLAGLDGATSHAQRPGAIVTGCLPFQQVARIKYHHIAWRAQGPRQGWIVQRRGRTRGGFSCNNRGCHTHIAARKGRQYTSNFTVEGSAPSTSEVPGHITIYRRVLPQRATGDLLAGVAANFLIEGCSPGCWGTPEVAQTEPTCAQDRVPAGIVPPRRDASGRGIPLSLCPEGWQPWLSASQHWSPS